jgi:putative sigma-54 modulation protein
MKIDLRVRGMAEPAVLRAQIERRMQFALGRFGHDVAQVTVRLSDENGPRGGVDKRCHLTIRGPRLATVVIDERNAGAEAAIDLAAGRASRAVARLLERRRERPTSSPH